MPNLQSVPEAADHQSASAPFAALAPHFPRFAQALSFHANGELAKARELYLLLMERPRLTAACLHQLATLAEQRAEHELAVELFRHSLRLDPSILVTYSKLANALSRLGHRLAALNVMLDQGCAQQNAGRYAEAELIYREILSNDLLNYGAYVNLGTCLAQMHRIAEATQQIFRAMQLYGRLDARVTGFAHHLASRIADKVRVPLSARLPNGNPSGRIEKIEDAITTLGKIMTEFCLPDEAILCHRQSIALAPGFALAHWNLSLALLSKGQYGQAWPEYEWRWHWDGFPEAQRYRQLQRWRGEPLAGKRILVWAEQGFGDTLQFAPLINQLVTMGAEVSFEVMRPLLRLLTQSLPGVRVIETPEAGQPTSPNETSDFAVANISLPAILGLDQTALPIATQYLAADTSAIARWAERLGPTGKRRVGVVWAGRPKPDVRRSIAFEALAPLLDRHQWDWYSLQVGLQADDIPKVSNIRIEDLSQGLTNFAETAAAMHCMDLIITVDTAAAHLAGGMGKPTWLLLPHVADWRWAATIQKASSETWSCWYPSVRIFKQSNDGQWDGVVQAVGAALDHLEIS
jgi:tetratricopeptide (TPR) repeat protein